MRTVYIIGKWNSSSAIFFQVEIEIGRNDSFYWTHGWLWMVNQFLKSKGLFQWTKICADLEDAPWCLVKFLSKNPKILSSFWFWRKQNVNVFHTIFGPQYYRQDRRQDCKIWYPSIILKYLDLGRFGQGQKNFRTGRKWLLMFNQHNYKRHLWIL